MKKLAAILLIILFLFNMVGYRFFFYVQQRKANAQTEASLDKQQYNPAQLITIQVPLSMPYLTSNAKFERVNGEITLNNKIYKYVERRVYNGVMELKCLPDYNKMRLETAKNDFYKSANDLPQNNQKESGKVFKNITTEFESMQQTASLHLVLNKQIFTPATQVIHLNAGLHLTPEQPPELA